ncbi:MAG: DUF3231 family protein [Firmicutes bacterium]|nr:DUF3231 family protein [Bacillota bacterium]
MPVKLEKRQQQIDIREAFNIWDVLNSKYIAVERLLTWDNLAHDLDLKHVINKALKSLEKNIATLEKLAAQYAVKTPDRNRSNVVFSGAQQLTTDEFIAMDLFLYYQSHIENLSRVLRSSVTNDSIRSVIKNMALKTIDETDTLVKYLKTKGWLSTPPLYKHIPLETSESLGVADAANLWDHLTLRYDNIRTTEYFISIAHDLDFKSILKMGLSHLQNQAKILEAEHRRYGIPLPKKPARVTLTLTNTEVLEDDYMYRILVNALQGAAIMHAQFYKESVICERIRAIFKDFLKDELGLIDQFLKFGKLKGWLNPVPAYGP